MKFKYFNFTFGSYVVGQVKKIASLPEKLAMMLFLKTVFFEMLTRFYKTFVVGRLEKPTV